MADEKKGDEVLILGYSLFRPLLYDVEQELWLHEDRIYSTPLCGTGLLEVRLILCVGVCQAFCKGRHVILGYVLEIYAFSHTPIDRLPYLVELPPLNKYHHLSLLLQISI